MADKSANKKYNRLISNTAIIAMGTLGSKVLVYLLVRFYTEILTRQEYSIASNIADIATLLIPVISLGIGEAVFRFAMDKNYREEEIFTLGFVAIAIGSAALPIIFLVFFNIDYFKNYVFLIIFYIIASSLHTVASQFIRAKAYFKLYAIQGIINTLLVIGLNILFLLPLKMGVVGYVLSTAVADILSTAFIFIVAKLWKYFAFSRIKKETLKNMLSYSLPLIPTTICWWVTNVSDRYMITFMKGDLVNGAYSAAYKIPTLLMVLIGIFNSAWKYSAVDDKNDGNDGGRFFSNVYKTFLAMVFGVSAIIIAFAKPLSAIMFSEEFRSAWIYIPALTAALLFSSLSSFTGTVFVIEKKSKYSLITSLVAAILNIILNFILIPLFDKENTAAMGAALATLISYIVMFILRLYFSSKLLKYSPQIILTLVNSIIILLMALAMTFEVKGYIIFEALGIALLVLVNAKSLVKTAKKLLYERSSKHS